MDVIQYEEDNRVQSFVTVYQFSAISWRAELQNHHRENKHEMKYNLISNQ